MNNKSVNIQKVMLNSDTSLGKLISKARDLRELNTSFANMVGKELAQNCSVEHFENGMLEIIANNASIATKLRFLEPKILADLRKNPTWMGVRSIKIKTHPDANSYSW
jgi:hypothetical protein